MTAANNEKVKKVQKVEVWKTESQILNIETAAKRKNTRRKKKKKRKQDYTSGSTCGKVSFSMTNCIIILILYIYKH